MIILWIQIWILYYNFILYNSIWNSIIQFILLFLNNNIHSSNSYSVKFIHFMNNNNDSNNLLLKICRFQILTINSLWIIVIKFLCLFKEWFEFWFQNKSNSYSVKYSLVLYLYFYIYIWFIIILIIIIILFLFYYL